ncbi:MAG: hypothetical protein DRJ52_02260 [Thermoprotei archaeon]|nr:MAG: hypothetical protein DRJ52_02260 [Thermoprotei archaeon]RLF01133.1 MAG: hypothetical protein DRJ63_00065 [Thermoprotei archaeon]
MSKLLYVILLVVLLPTVIASPILIEVKINPKLSSFTEVFCYIVDSRSYEKILEIRSRFYNLVVQVPSPGEYIVVAGYISDEEVFIGFTETKIEANTSIEVKVSPLSKYREKTIRIKVLEASGKPARNYLIVARLLDKILAIGQTDKNGIVALLLPDIPGIKVDIWAPSTQTLEGFKAKSAVVPSIKVVELKYPLQNETTVSLALTKPAITIKGTYSERKFLDSTQIQLFRALIIVIISIIVAATVYFFSKKKI